MPPEDVAPVVAPVVEVPIVTPIVAPVVRAPASPSIEELAAQLAAANPASKPASETPDAPEVVAPVVEVPPEPVKTPVKKPDLESSRFAALSKREREARQREADAKQRLAVLENRQKELVERETRIKGAGTPLEILKAHGYKYEDATMEAVGAFKPREVDPMDSKLQTALNPVSGEVAELKKQLTETFEVVKQLQADRVAGIQHQVMREFKEAAESGGYEYVLAYGQEALNLAKDIALRHKANTGRLLTYNESLDIVEGYYSKKAEAIAATKKFQSRLTQPAQNPASSKPTNPVSPAKSEPTPTKPAVRTLTQSHSQTNRARPDLEKMSDRDALDWIASNVLKTVEK